jgi:hypothetical protein
MSTNTLETDEVLEQVLEDERAAAVQKFRELEELVVDAVEPADARRWPPQRRALGGE